ncbi:hypothetical protein GQ53DRAFT_832814 [Thozetella sp. PMI_491]|nr:hypothetical protein GQ53DRAFT_832814 [Thozetella sp. PMI_491]
MRTSALASSAGLLLGLLAQSAMATVNVGTDSSGATAAWIGGESECSHAVVAQANVNPCGHVFTLDNGFSYQLEGCGGAGLSLFNGDGSFNSNCEFVGNIGLQCGITEHWSCF